MKISIQRTCCTTKVSLSKKIISLSFIWFLLLMSVSLSAQQGVVTGVIKNAVTGELMAGVTIREKGTGKNAISDDKGGYKITVADLKTSILVFSMTGFGNRELGIAGKKTLDVTLTEIVTSLDDVVVIGYGIAKKKDVLTSIGKANVEDMQKAPVQSFDQMLAGRVAGVNVVSSDGQPGGAATITIRGSTVSQETSPLYVIDGLPVENIDINSINPKDIESFEILKDPAAVAIYGSRGSNGVILITTRKGKPGPPRVAYSFNGNIQQNTKKIPMMNPYEFVKLQLELDSINSTPTVPSTRFRSIYLDPANGIDLNYYKTVPGYNWQDLVMQTGHSQNHNINVSGGNNDTKYSLSGGYFDQKGLIINTGMKRINGRFSLDQKLNSFLRTGVSASYSNTVAFGTIAATANTGGVVQGMWQYRPVNGIKSQDLLNSLIDSTSFQDVLNGTATSFGDNLVNPLVQAQNEYRKTITNTAIVNLYLEANITSDLKFRISGGYNSTNIRQDQFYNSQTQQGLLFRDTSRTLYNKNGINGSISSSLSQTYSTSNTLNYSKTFNKVHKFDALAGFEYQYADNFVWKYSVIQIPQATEYLGILSLNSGTASNATQNQGSTKNQLYSFFGRLNYNYNKKYYLMAALREDGSSKFSSGHQWGWFPSGAAAWTFSEEPFFRKLSSVINYGKLRISYGVTGNNRVGDFSYLSQWGGLETAVSYPFNNTYTTGIRPFFYGNDSLTWEKTTGIDIGLNLELFRGKVSFEAIYYQKRSDNFIYNVTLPFTAGYSNGSNTQYQNIGIVSNSGFEFTVTTNNVKTKNFSWSSNFNIAFNRNKIIEFYNGLQAIQTGWSLPSLPGTATTAWIAKKGAPISQFYGYKWGGVYQYTDFINNANGTFTLKPGIPAYASGVQPGDPKYLDINGDGVVDANDQTTLGSPLPVHTGGFANNFTYKNWSANIFFQWSSGNSVLNVNRIVFESTGGYALNYNQFASYANRWTPTNPTNDIPRARYNSKGDVGSPNIPRPSSRVVEDASFLRLKTISISYNLPKGIIKKMKINGAALTLSAQNIFTWTKYSGMDPEVSTYRASNPANSPFGGSNVGSSSVGGAGYTFIQPSTGFPALAGGYDYTPYPRSLILNFGANITF